MDRLILCGAPARTGLTASAQRDDESSTAQWRRDFLALHAPPPAAADNLNGFVATRVAQLTGPAALPEGARLASGCMAAVNPTIWRRALQALLDFDRSAELEHIRVPTLLIAGEHDAAAPPTLLAATANRIDGSSYAQLRGVGHLMQLEAPEQFDVLVLDFLVQAKRFEKPVLH